MATSTQSRIDCQICGNSCYKENNNSSGDRLCRECTRSEYTSAEKLQRPQEQQKNEDLSNKLFPHPEKFQRRKITSTPLESQTKISKRPLRCPYRDCAKFVGVFDISPHFKCEHKEVPHIMTHFDARNALEFSAKDVKRGCIRTMLLLNLDDSGNIEPKTPSTALSKSSSCFSKENSTLLVLATKLSEYDVDDKLRDKPRKHRTDEIKDTDKWIFWVGSNISTNLSYTIAISTLDNETRLKYFGPVVHLEESPVKLWGNGRCLLMNRFNIERMSQNFQKNLNLDVIIYTEE
ncbi:uncharacterized protein LOC123677960 [Harmonia axyridis]|uniref:uncharacterized protein LOC123677960 n=1 Tax=Harmonia axyridis TaxID=115357 RepID=UPI001E2765CE|nr:uncharacterized protein LOC123677960 [Harmonia axyridis]